MASVLLLLAVCWSVTSFFAVCACVCVSRAELGPRKTENLHHTAWKSNKSLHMIFFVLTWEIISNLVQVSNL